MAISSRHHAARRLSRRPSRRPPDRTHRRSHRHRRRIGIETVTCHGPCAIGCSRRATPHHDDGHKT
uniref:Uncharacterized protein n=1 Tax=Rhodococcoides fascians D188 TaxID=1051973 RepID=G8JYX2_RHOFA|nr:hypothetical protein pFi_107 [Rhodococcus fascians D188]